MSDKNILDDIFNAKEEDVETFADVFLGKTEGSTEQGVRSDSQKIVDAAKGKGDTVAHPDLKISRNGYIEISFGWHERDHVWHISPWHEKKQYRVTLNRVVYAISKVMSSRIPSHIHVDIFLPNKHYSIPEITFKAKGLLDDWSVRDDDIKELNEQIFEVLNTLV